MKKYINFSTDSGSYEVCGEISVRVDSNIVQVEIAKSPELFADIASDGELWLQEATTNTVSVIIPMNFISYIGKEVDGDTSWRRIS